MIAMSKCFVGEANKRWYIYLGVLIMQRVTNCILNRNHQILMLQKPRRGWWTAPGGKMEPLESIIEAIVREYKEETGLVLIDPELRGVFTIVVEENGNVVDEWMMFTFLAYDASGEPLQECEEGILQWHSIESLQALPTALGDQQFLTHIASGGRLIMGKFVYTPDYDLIRSEIY
jgi:8-oxo-dGTP diphosphatase